MTRDGSNSEPADRASKSASVIVCTQNRSSFLADVCKKLVELDFPRDRWELLIVDNGSTDDTFEIASAVEREHPDLVRVVQEPEIGLSVARNRGVAEASGDVLAFIDDDAFPNKSWLSELVDAFGDPEVFCAGGPVEPMFQGDGELPSWFLGRFLAYLTVWDLGPDSVELAYNEYPRGANIAYRRETFENFGLFSPHLGRKGKRLLSCEETEHCLRIERGGGKTIYVPDARVRHLTVEERITPEWMMKRFRAQGQSEVIINWMHGGWAGVRTGLKRFKNLAGEAKNRRAIDGDVLTSCHREAYQGYLFGIPNAVTRTPRYVADNGHAEPSDWTPLA